MLRTNSLAMTARRDWSNPSHKSTSSFLRRLAARLSSCTPHGGVHPRANRVNLGSTRHGAALCVAHHMPNVVLMTRKQELSILEGICMMTEDFHEGEERGCFECRISSQTVRSDEPTPRVYVYVSQVDRRIDNHSRYVDTLLGSLRKGTEERPVGNIDINQILHVRPISCQSLVLKGEVVELHASRDFSGYDIILLPGNELIRETPEL